MDIIVEFKKLGNHWYPSINHDNIEDLQLDLKIERSLSMLDKYKEGRVVLQFSEQNTILYNNTIQFRDEDLTRYFTTNDDFDFIVYIGERTFPVSSTLYSLLEDLFNFNFHKILYSCNTI